MNFFPLPFFPSIIFCCLLSLTANGSESAESCSLAEKSLKADLNRAPNNVLPIFGDAVRISPNCLRGLFRTAIQTARPDEGLLEQMILVALNEFPEEANTIAEVCFEEAPDKANVIKAAFVSAPDSAQKKAGNIRQRESASPIDRFLQEQQPMESAAESVKDENADRKIQEAVAKMTASLEGKATIIPTPRVVLPNALVEEKTIAGKLPPWGGNRPVLSTDAPVEEESEPQIGSPPEEKPESLPVSYKVIDEITGGRKSEPIVIDDRPETNRDAGDAFRNRKEKLSAEKAPGFHEMTSPPLPRTNWPPSVYYIPPAQGVGKGLASGLEEPSLNRQSSIILRSIPVSPTSPR